MLFSRRPTLRPRGGRAGAAPSEAAAHVQDAARRGQPEGEVRDGRPHEAALQRGRGQFIRIAPITKDSPLINDIPF